MGSLWMFHIFVVGMFYGIIRNETCLLFNYQHGILSNVIVSGITVVLQCLNGKSSSNVII
jgi:hypothetical protein